MSHVARKKDKPVSPHPRDAFVPRRAGSLPLVTCLRELASNLWWTWHPEVLGLFRELDPAAWRQLDHNPITLLQALSAEEIESRAGALALHNRIYDAYRQLRAYLESQTTWGDTHAGILRARP